MAPLTIEEQFKFLITCVKHSNNGKVDFDAVAAECEIVSKGAAAKRYERLLKANGVNPNGGGPIATGGEPATPTEGSPKKARKPATPKTPKSKPTTPRKRKGKNEDESPLKKFKSEERVDENSDDDVVKNDSNNKIKAEEI